MDLGCVDVLESTPRVNSPKGCDGTSGDASGEVFIIWYAVSQHRKACLDDPIISTCLGKVLVKWVVVEDML